MFGAVIYCEIAGKNCPVGCKISIGERRVKGEYSELIEKIEPEDIDVIADLIRAPRGSVSIITPEEYAERYGDEEDN